MIITKQDVLNLSQEQINNMDLADVKTYAARTQSGILTRIAEALGIRVSYVSDIMSGKRKAKNYRSLVDAKAREELLIYIENNQLSNEPSKD